MKKGYKQTEENKLKISKCMIGKKNSLGVKPSMETKMKMSISHKYGYKKHTREQLNEFLNT